MRIAILQFPGSNCERETILAVQRAGMEAVPFLWNTPAEQLAECQGFIIVGGFSYEDRSRAGIIAAQDPIMQAIKHQSELGKPVLGICNGAQILVESGLVPGLENHQVGLALTDNKRIQQGKVLGTGYYNAWINMRLSDHYQLNAFTRHLTPKTILNVPVAHAEGRFIIPPALLKEMLNNGLHVFQYCDEHGALLNEFPVNPNGSIENIAAVSNKAGNVMAMMPHPERTTAGDAIFQSMRDYIAEGHFVKVPPLCYLPRHAPPARFHSPHAELIVELNITDNHALSVANALKQAGMATPIKRFIHWEIACDNTELLEKIKASGLLYNLRKETLVSQDDLKQTQRTLLLVRAKEDMIGQQKLQLLQDHFHLDGIEHLQHSILWQVDSDTVPWVLHSNILASPYAHDCYYY